MQSNNGANLQPQLAYCQTISIYWYNTFLMEKPKSTEWPWGQELDAVEAAPDSHKVIFENDSVRLLKVCILPGIKEPFHIHQWPSKMIVLESTRINYYDETGKSTTYEERETPFEESLEPEGLHAVENIDSSKSYVGFRLEYKTLEAVETSSRS